MTDDDLRDLLTDAVSDVEPAYRLGEIRARTHRPARRGWYAVGGAILAAAAVVTAVSIVHDDEPRRASPASDPDHAVGLYFVGDTPDGQRLFREFQQLPKDAGPLAALEAITRAEGPDDPDYRTTWPAGSFESVSVREGRIDVELGAPALESRMFGPLIVQQVVYTLQAATGEELPVHFTEDGQTIDGHLYVRAPQNRVLALVNISDPADELHVRDSFIARGRANAYEGTVPWEIRDDDGIVKEGFATAAGSIDRLYEWETERIDVSDLPPGQYIFIAYRDSDPEGNSQPYYDTRWITVD